jgi:uncharacterized membrane protein
VRGLVIVSVICLVAGVGLIFGYCIGTTGLQLGTPISSSSLRMNIVTTGWPALTGLALMALGAILQIVAVVVAVSGLIWRSEETLKRREEPFEG